VTGEAAEIYRNINQVRLKPSSEVDGQLIRGISEGREGVKIQLADQQRSLAFLERWFEANPMDRHRRRYDERRLALEEARHAEGLMGDTNFVAAVQQLIDATATPVPNRALPEDDE